MEGSLSTLTTRPQVVMTFGHGSMHNSDRPAEVETVATVDTEVVVAAVAQEEMNGKVEEMEKAVAVAVAVEARKREEDVDVDVEEEAVEAVEEAKSVKGVLEQVKEPAENVHSVKIRDVQDHGKDDEKDGKKYMHAKHDVQGGQDAQDGRDGQVTRAEDVSMAVGVVNKELVQETAQEQPVSEPAPTTTATGKQLPAAAAAAAAAERSSPEQPAEPKAVMIEEKIAVHYEGDDGKEVVSNGHSRGQSGAGLSDDGEGYAMSSTAYPGSWEPAYYGWS
ncbi:hypothetical protein BZA05DRAFT_407912 [Tricharina praecox]|uniref:uncharacterized protein n=1 Tax=Tricharina praecox TaxID=43433 RepID=UPI002220F837|nr:uncharacterized protein BZA05DRAFT_407912 [Tricharina praecox]KAI5845512.1 hypothetical protein BZA05DRAFT_407912 [Tricharina praecox]